MAEGARVQSIDAIRAFRPVLVKFAEAADAALSDAEGEMTRTLLWLEVEQPSHWRGQMRQRTESLARAKEALRQKTLFRDSTGRPPPADEERKAVAAATRAVEEARQKLLVVKRWMLELRKEMSAYRGAAQRMVTTVQTEIPRALARLDHVTTRLEAYVSLTAPPTVQTSDAGDDETMARPADLREQHQDGADAESEET